jgi:deoxyadenosine/deoxycytidine kinase
VQEPLESWEGHILHDRTVRNYLKDFYDIPSELTARRLQVVAVSNASLRFFNRFLRQQARVLMSLLGRYRTHRGQGGVTIYERSMRVAREVFLESSRALLAPEDYTFLYELAEYGEKAYEASALSIYLACGEGEMMDRVKARGRVSEENIS